MSVSAPTRVLVAGGGVAGLETVLALQALAGDRLEIELLAPGPPLHLPAAGGRRAVPAPAACSASRSRRSPRTAACACTATRSRACVPDERAVETQGGARLGYDALVLALGARPRRGGARRAHVPRPAGRRPRAPRSSSGCATARCGGSRSSSRAAPPGRCRCTSWRCRPRPPVAAPRRAELTLVTPEPAPLAAFGAEAGAASARCWPSAAWSCARGVHAERVRTAVGCGSDRTARSRPTAWSRCRGCSARACAECRRTRSASCRSTSSRACSGSRRPRGRRHRGARPQAGRARGPAGRRRGRGRSPPRAGAPVAPRPYRPVLRGLLLTGGEVRYLRHDPGGASEASDELLWWPPAKIAGPPPRALPRGAPRPRAPARAGPAIALAASEPRDAPLGSRAVEPIRLVIADDHAVVRAGCGCCSTPRRASRVVAEAGEVDTARAHGRAPTGPTCSCSTSTCPGRRACPAIPELARAAPRVVVLTMQNDPAFAREALQSGARGYVLKEAADAELVGAVRAAAEGRTYLNPELGARMAAAPPAPDGPARRPDRARGRDPAPDRARPHERRDRRAALPQRAHGRVAPRAHPAEDAPHARARSSSATRSTTGCSTTELAQSGKPAATVVPPAERLDLQPAAHQRRALAHPRERRSPSVGSAASKPRPSSRDAHAHLAGRLLDGDVDARARARACRRWSAPPARAGRPRS